MSNHDFIVAFKKYIETQSELTPDNQRLLMVLPSLLELQNKKSLVYGESYSKYEDFSIFMNVQRKFDRIENLMKIAMKNGIDKLYQGNTGVPTETFVDTVVDMAVYSLLWAGFIAKTHPEQFNKFVESNGLSCGFITGDKQN